MIDALKCVYGCSKKCAVSEDPGETPVFDRPFDLAQSREPWGFFRGHAEGPP